MKDKYDEFIDTFDGKGYDRIRNLYYNKNSKSKFTSFIITQDVILHKKDQFYLVQIQEREKMN